MLNWFVLYLSQNYCHFFRQEWLLPPASEGWGKVLFSVCQFTSRRGEGTPSCRQGGGGGTPSQVRMGGGWWVLHFTSGWWGGGYPHPRSGWGVGVSPLQVWMGTGATTILGQDGGQGVPPSQVRTGVPPSQDRGTPLSRIGVPPHPGPRSGQLEQHCVYLLRGGRYACCVHAGGLSCYLMNLWSKLTGVFFFNLEPLMALRSVQMKSALQFMFLEFLELSRVVRGCLVYLSEGQDKKFLSKSFSLRVTTF